MYNGRILARGFCKSPSHHISPAAKDYNLRDLIEASITPVLPVTVLHTSAQSAIKTNFVLLIQLSGFLWDLSAGVLQIAIQYFSHRVLGNTKRWQRRFLLGKCEVQSIN